QVEVQYFTKKAEFWQNIKIKKNGKIKISGTYEYQACTEEKCIFPPAEPFELWIENNSASTTENTTSANPSTPSAINIDSSQHLKKSITSTDSTSKNVSTEKNISTSNTPSAQNVSQLSKWLIFTEGFLGGLAALLTPCVFPLIPMNISFFTKRHKDRKK